MKDPVFYGREAELKALRAAYESPKAEMVLVYGPRCLETYEIEPFWRARMIPPAFSASVIGHDAFGHISQ